ncbi:hypothetical protein CEXT_718601 [Caerostris extrusa]|uniref:Uncharacterized protein n=1 Tax=Caerostris extrusa TaxID=172846 RepID=A0AAV4UTP8_CAEEX|nr:hypothetical protein CEXT_718601 [Caerostris extrusa]
MRLLALLSTYFGRGKPISDDTATPTTHPGLFLGRDEIYNDVSAKEGGDCYRCILPPIKGRRGKGIEKCRVNLIFSLETGSLNFVKMLYLFLKHSFFRIVVPFFPRVNGTDFSFDAE